MIKSYLFIREQQWINHFNHIGSSGLLCISVINIHPTLILPHALQSSSLSMRPHGGSLFLHTCTSSGYIIPWGNFLNLLTVFSLVLLSWFWDHHSLSRLSILGVLSEYLINIHSIFSYQTGSTIVLFHSAFRFLCMYLLPIPLTF